MFGYVKALKAEMKFREHERYRSVYCGLCKAIGKSYGQLPRLAVSYDLTFLLVLVEALQAEQPQMRAGTCVLHPVKKHAVAQPDPVLEIGAAIAVLLAASKLDDNKKDGDKPVSTAGLRLMTASAVKKAKAQAPEIATTISTHLDKLERMEAEGAGLVVQAEAFGSLLADLSVYCSTAAQLEPLTEHSVALLCKDLGTWVYLIDALDDFPEDMAGKGRSFILAKSTTEAATLVEPLLLGLEQNLEKTAALLPYQRDAGIIANVLLDGLSSERARVLKRLSEAPQSVVR